MDYFDNINPYMVRQEQPATPTQQAPVVAPTPISNEQSYVENILRLNIGKVGTFYFTYNGSTEWRDQTYTGILEQGGRDHFIIKDLNTERRYILMLVYLLWAEFDENINYTY